MSTKLVSAVERMLRAWEEVEEDYRNAIYSLVVEEEEEESRELLEEMQRSVSLIREALKDSQEDGHASPTE